MAGTIDQVISSVPYEEPTTHWWYGCDAEGIEAYRGTVLLPFEPGAHKRVAVKIVDDRGIESLKIIPVP